MIDVGSGFTAKEVSYADRILFDFNVFALICTTRQRSIFHFVIQHFLYLVCYINVFTLHLANT